ncbi:MAG: hypothetical protein OXG23_07895 [Chloroflexi bacterium]|nr:hypothetical protein [Chloroflexota bacterium]
MSDLFEKISTLINAQLNDFLGKNPQSPLARIRLDADEAEENPQRSARSLRQRLEEALDYEDELQARIEERMREAVELDKLVDEMLRSGDEFSAQRLQGQLNMKQQQLTIAESELRDHRLMTQHLMQELGSLEMALDSQQRRERAQGGAASSSRGRTRIPIDGVASSGRPRGRADRSILNTMSAKFEETRENLESLLGNPPVSKRTEPRGVAQRFEIVDEEPDPRAPKPRKKDEPDMNARLSRLSKPSEDE